MHRQLYPVFRRQLGLAVDKPLYSNPETGFSWNFSNLVEHRDKGVIPGCRAAPHDETLLEQRKITDEDTSEVFCKIIQDYQDGLYHGWDKASQDLSDIRHNTSQAAGLRRVIVRRLKGGNYAPYMASSIQDS